MRLNKNTNDNYTVRQPKLSLETERLIDTSDPVYTFYEIVDHIDLSKYSVVKRHKTGRPRRDEHKLLKVILPAFMKHGISSLCDIEKLYRSDIRHLYPLDSMKIPFFAIAGSSICRELTDSIEQIFLDVSTYIFQRDYVDLEHVYLDRTEIEANANRYTWVWKESYTRNHGEVSKKISMLLDATNQEVLGYSNLESEKREEYAIGYVSEPLEPYRKDTELGGSMFVSGCGRRKGIY